MMMERFRRPAAHVAVAAGVLLGFVSAGPLTWGLGVLVAVALIIAGVVVLTDRRPAHMRQRRPYDRERDDRGRPKTWTAARTQERLR